MARKKAKLGATLVVVLVMLAGIGLILSLWPAMIASIKSSTTNIAEVLPKPLTDTDVFNQINVYRTENKMVALKRNEKLDKAALSRLLVIKNNQDFTGDKTGLSLENAVKNNGYSYSVLGEIYAEQVRAETNLADEWNKDAEQKKILDEKNYREIGLAIEKDGPTYRVVVVMARLMAVKVEKLGAGGYPVVAWGGPELWEAVNKRRVEMGVGQLSRKDELCTIASIRLNQLLELGKLDGHAGFEPTLNRPDLAWIKQKYNVAEYLIVGYLTPTEAVAGWEHTLGHRGLLAGGEYVWGCVYSQNTFAVAIAAY